MPPSHPSINPEAWEQIWWPLALAPGTLGALEWISGAVFLAADRSAVDRIQAEGPRDEWERELDRTRVHEVFHYIQVLTTGFMYHWVDGLTKMVKAAIGEALGGKGLAERAPTFEEFAELLAELPSSLVRPWRSLMQEHVDELERPREDGLTIRDIMESHATYVEIRTQYGCNGPGLLELYERHEVESVYRRAFDYASDRLGLETAFDAFSCFAFLALCSSDPVLSFTRLVDRAGSIVRETDSEEATLDLKDLSHYCCGYVYLGSPIDWPAPPVLDAYGRSLDAVRKEKARGEFDTAGFFTNPFETLRRWDRSEEEQKLQILPSLVYEPELSGPRAMANAVRDEQTYGSFTWSLCEAAAFRRIFDSLEPFDPARVKRLHEEERSIALEAARRGQSVDAVFNLGQIAQRRGESFPARVWWRQAAADGDPTAMKALGIAHSQGGKLEEAEYWLAKAIEANSGLQRTLVPLSAEAWLKTGENVDSEDHEAALHCFRRAADEGSLVGAYRYARAVIEEDLIEGLAFLAAACGTGSRTGAREEIDAILDADRLFQSYRKAMGPLRRRRVMREVEQRLLEM